MEDEGSGGRISWRIPEVTLRQRREYGPVMKQLMPKGLVEQRFFRGKGGKEARL